MNTTNNDIANKLLQINLEAGEKIFELSKKEIPKEEILDIVHEAMRQAFSLGFDAAKQTIEDYFSKKTSGDP